MASSSRAYVFVAGAAVAAAAALLAYSRTRMGGTAAKDTETEHTATVLAAEERVHLESGQCVESASGTKAVPERKGAAEIYGAQDSQTAAPEIANITTTKRREAEPMVEVAEVSEGQCAANLERAAVEVGVLEEGGSLAGGVEASTEFDSRLVADQSHTEVARAAPVDISNTSATAGGSKSAEVAQAQPPEQTNHVENVGMKVVGTEFQRAATTKAEKVATLGEFNAELCVKSEESQCIKEAVDEVATQMFEEIMQSALNQAEAVNDDCEITSVLPDPSLKKIASLDVVEVPLAVTTAEGGEPYNSSAPSPDSVLTAPRGNTPEVMSVPDRGTPANGQLASKEKRGLTANDKPPTSQDRNKRKKKHSKKKYNKSKHVADVMVEDVGNVDDAAAEGRASLLTKSKPVTDTKVAGATTRQANSKPLRSNVPCKFFAMGKCSYGSKCRFSHVATGVDANDAAIKDTPKAERPKSGTSGSRGKGGRGKSGRGGRGRGRGRARGRQSRPKDKTPAGETAGTT